MNIAIVGFGSQGESTLDYFQNTAGSHMITVCDRNPELKLPDGVVSQLGEQYLDNLSRFDLIVRAPSVHPKDIAAANRPNILEKVTSNTNIFFENCPSRNIIGVTGTKGKGTTSTLIASMLESAGKRVHLGGNIGTPPLEMLKANIQPKDWVVLELANFQLIDLKYSPPIAVCLMVVPEHMDWHADVNEYLQAKEQLFRWQKHGDVTVYFSENEMTKQIINISQAEKIPYFAEPGAIVKNDVVSIEGQIVCPISEIKLLGRHNWQNVCAAATVAWQIIHDTDPIRRALQTVTGLPFRLEFIREVNGVGYYDDSYGTTPETAIVAIEAFTEPKVIILGGSDKGAGYEQLAWKVADSNVKAAITIGETGPKITEELLRTGYKNVIEGAASMPEIVKQASSAAETGDVVLLSTGCASFGMFRDYKDRGEQFNAAVRSLA